MHSIHHILKKILFPTNCIVCGKRDVTLCQSCLELLPLNTQVYHKATHFELTLFPYSHKKISRIIWELKYKNNVELRSRLFERIGPFVEKTLETILGNDIDTLFLVSVPKPKHDRVKKRDFDHGLLLAQAFLPHLQKYPLRIISEHITKKDMPRQATLKNRSERLEKIKGSIIPKTSLLGQPPTDGVLLIIDDVTTTGATRDEMIRVMRRFFNGKIIFIALAH